MSRPLLLALAITLLAASIASAGPARPEAGPTPGGRFAELDRNRDGWLSLEELMHELPDDGSTDAGGSLGCLVVLVLSGVSCCCLLFQARRA